MPGQACNGTEVFRVSKMPTLWAPGDLQAVRDLLLDNREVRRRVVAVARSIYDKEDCSKQEEDLGLVQGIEDDLTTLALGSVEAVRSFRRMRTGSSSIFPPPSTNAFTR